MKQSYDELPKLTESYIKQMNDETEKQSYQKYSENHNRNRVSRFSPENILYVNLIIIHCQKDCIDKLISSNKNKI